MLSECSIPIKNTNLHRVGLTFVGPASNSNDQHPSYIVDPFALGLARAEMLSHSRAVIAHTECSMGAVLV